MNDPGHPSPDASSVESTVAGDPAAEWQALPRRARPLFVLSGMSGFLVPALIAATSIVVLDLPVTWPLLAAALVVLGFWGYWLGLKQYRYSLWLHDENGLAVRRGRLWQQETRVPATRVQHLDVKRGPLQRRRNLATLVVHTAGTRNSAVTVHNLDADDAERLRDALSRQIDHDDHA